MKKNEFKNLKPGDVIFTHECAYLFEGFNEVDDYVLTSINGRENFGKNDMLHYFFMTYHEAFEYYSNREAMDWLIDVEESIIYLQNKDIQKELMT